MKYLVGVCSSWAKKVKEWGFMDHVKHEGYRWIHNEQYLARGAKDDA